MNRYTVNVASQISGSVEVEANTEDEALEMAGQMDYDEWDEVVIDSTDTPDDPELLAVICDECEEDEDDCICDDDCEDDE
jgi:hypothetical protein